jgi:large subunit ribosomal protein L18
VRWAEAELKDLAASEQAERAGALLAERAKAAGIETAVFDRGGHRYHGNIAKFAGAAREAGQKF